MTNAAADAIVIPLQGRITAYSVGRVWSEALAALTAHPDRPVVVDAAGLTFIDDTGIAMIFDLKNRPRAAGAAVEIRGLAANLAALIPADPGGPAGPVAGKPKVGVLEHG
jgi:anti-anti-sigma regulatory factor